MKSVCAALALIGATVAGGNAFGAESPVAAPAGPKKTAERGGKDATEQARSAAIKLISRLAEEGVVEIEVLRGAAIPKNLKSYAIAWRGRNFLGGLFVAGPGATVEDLQNSLITGDAAACVGGDFASAARNSEVAALTIRRVWTSCSGPYGFSDAYSLFPLRAGGFYLFTSSASSLRDAEDADDMILEAFTGTAPN